MTMPSQTSVLVNVRDLGNYVSIDMPILSSSLQTSLAILGGSECLERAVRNKATYVSMKLPGSHADTLRSQVVGTREFSTGFILKVRRSKSTDTSNYSVVGKTTSSYNFKQPVDFQVWFPVPMVISF